MIIMKKATIAVLAVVLLAAPALAQQTRCAGWEEAGATTILGSYGNVGNDRIVTAPEPVYAGTYACSVQETPVGGTPQAYVAYIEFLTDGDVIDASFYTYDDTAGASPSTRIWAHYAQSGDVTSYAGSASGPSAYSAGTGWEQMSGNWVFDSDGGTRDALVIEFRLYSAGEDTYYMDDVCVTAPDHARITLAGEPPIAVDSESWTGIKALYR
jgi:hypothetical protein